MARVGKIAANGQGLGGVIYAGGLLVILLIGQIGTCAAAPLVLHQLACLIG
jgi:hypothetical protein